MNHKEMHKRFDERFPDEHWRGILGDYPDHAPAHTHDPETGEYTNSIFNSIMLDYEEHKQADGHNQFEMGDERRIYYLSKTIVRILRSGYIIQDRDKKFLDKIKQDFDKAVELIK